MSTRLTNYHTYSNLIEIGKCTWSKLLILTRGSEKCLLHGDMTVCGGTRHRWYAQLCLTTVVTSIWSWRRGFQQDMDIPDWTAYWVFNCVQHNKAALQHPIGQLWFLDQYHRIGGFVIWFLDQCYRIVGCVIWFLDQCYRIVRCHLIPRSVL